MNSSSNCDTASSSCDWNMDCDDSLSLVDEIRVMRRREHEYLIQDYLQPELLSSSCNGNTSEPVDLQCRTQMCDWCIQIVDHCEFSRSTVAIALNILDRFLQKASWALVDRSAFQLAVITSLYTAIKVHEPLALCVKTMAKLSRNVYTTAQIEAMELVMMEADKWLMNPPTCFMFSHFFCEVIARASDQRLDFTTLFDLTKLQLEQSLKDYDLSLLAPSTVAFAAVMNTLEGMEVSMPIFQELVGLLASTSEIDASTPLIEETRVRLYEGITETDEHGHMVASNKACQSPIRPASPRTVSALRVGSPRVV